MYSCALPAALLGYPSDPSPLMINPVATSPVVPTGGEYTGGPANSGIMGREDGTFQDFSLTFPEPGTYVYVCLVHGWEMSGTVVVKPADEPVPSPEETIALANQEIAHALARVPAVRAAARQQITPPTENPDGTMTHYILLGYHDNQIDLMRFFPDKTVVQPGDTVVWEMSPANGAPHTVTFLNGEAAPPLFEAVQQQSGPPLIYIAPGTLFPSQLGMDLTRSGVYSSGVVEPVPGPFYSLVVGDMTPGPQPYLCLLHDESGMKGTLIVLPR